MTDAPSAHRLRRGRMLCLTLVLVAGCQDQQACLAPPPPECLPSLELPEGPLRLDRASAGLDGDRVRVRGFAGAAPPGARVIARYGTETLELQADARGAFDGAWMLPATSGQDAGPESRSVVELSVGEARAVHLRVRAEDALRCVPQAATPTGTLPNDLIIGRCGASRVAWVAASGDGSISVHALLPGPVPAAIPFELDETERGANPWALALAPGGERAGVSLFGQNRVALVDACAGSVLDARAAMSADGAPLHVEVNPPAELDIPFDADGDGTLDARVARMRPTRPQGVAFVGDRLLVSFVNLLQSGARPQHGPGLVVAFDIVEDRLIPAGEVVLPCQNPQSITLDEEGRPWASCSGPLGPTYPGFAALEDGALVRIDASTLEVRERIELGRFAPGTPAFDEEHIVVGSLVRPEILVLPRGATELEDGTVLLLPEPERTESVFDAASLGKGLFAVAEYSGDRVHVVDATGPELDPWPFEDGIPVGPGGIAFRGAQALDRDLEHQYGEDAPDAAVLLGLSAEVVPLKIWQVLGP